MTNKEISLRATRTLALLKETTVISKKDGSKLTEDERFFVFLCGYWYFASLVNDAGEDNLDYNVRFKITENSSKSGARGYISMRDFVNCVSSYIQYLLSTFSPKIQEKYSSFCVKKEFSKFPLLLDDIQSYLKNINLDFFVETHYHDYICLDPINDKVTLKNINMVLMKKFTIKIVKWIFYLPLSLIGGTIAGVICKIVMPYIALIILWCCGVDYYRGPVLFDFENTIYDTKISIISYIVAAATIMASIIVFGIVAGWIAGKMCPAKNPHVGATTIAVLLLICCVFSVFKMWDPDRLFVCITSIISYALTITLSYTTAYSINEES